MKNGILMDGENLLCRRGDTGVIRVRVYPHAPIEGFSKRGEVYRWREGDTATITIKRKIKDESPILQKESADGFFVFTHDDTKALPFGIYWYDIQVKTREAQYFTVAGPAQFHLLPSIQGG